MKTLHDPLPRASLSEETADPFVARPDRPTVDVLAMIVRVRTLW